MGRYPVALIYALLPLPFWAFSSALEQGNKPGKTIIAGLAAHSQRDATDRIATAAPRSSILRVKLARPAFLDLARGAAAVAGQEIAIVARFFRHDNAVGADWRAVRRAVR